LTVECDEVLLEAARAVRSQLPELLPDSWRKFDRALARLVADPAGDPARIVALLESQPAVGTWVFEFTVRWGPALMPEIDERGGGEQPPPGAGVLLLPPRYACPVDGAYVQYVTAGQQVKDCPDHGVLLVRAAR